MGGDVGFAAGRGRQRNGSRLDPAVVSLPQAGTAQVVGEVSGIEVFEGGQPDYGEPSAVPKVPRGHCLGRQGRWLGNPHRRREQEVGLEASHECSVRQLCLEPVKGIADRLWPDPGVGMLGVIPDEIGKRRGGTGDALRRIPEHVHGAAREMCGSNALCGYRYVGAFLGKPQSCHEPGGSGANHESVVDAPRASSGHVRCSTSRRPWKIQSSSRACRSWSP